MNGVGDNDDFGNILFTAYLVNAASNGEEFSFYTGDEGCMINCLDQRVIMNVNVRDRYGNVVFDASISYNNCCVR